MNSTLVEYACLSPNNSGERTHAIDRITPHCVVGQLSVEALGEIFMKPSKKASCNYGIGADGRVGLYVDEGNRSWCSSSAPNDQRAVTIECASDKEAPYAFNELVYNKLITLCVDICKRNNKTKLIWIEDKDTALKYEPAEDEMLLTVHRWFAKKECPGAWLMERMNDLASKVTAQLAPNVVELKGNSSEAKIWNFFSAWLNDYAVAGIMGNLKAESNLRSDNLQNAYNKKLGLSDEEYTRQVDDGSYENFVHDSAGYGVAQWTFWSRKEGLLKEVKAKGVSISDLQTQLEYVKKEMEAKVDLMSVLASATSVRQATEAVLKLYEKPADQSLAVITKRTEYGQTYFNQFHKEEKKLYRVQVGAFSVKENADKLASRLAELGFKSITKKVEVNGISLYRVQVGAFSDKLNAEAMQIRLRGVGVDSIIAVV